MLSSAFRRWLLLLLLSGGSLCLGAAPEVFTIKTVPGQMQYDVNLIAVRPGAEVKLTFVNQDQMIHNLIFFQAGTDAITLCNQQAANPKEALKRDWLPNSPAVWLHSKNLDPGTRQELSFKAPAVPGLYPYVCSMPGHAQIMNGQLMVYAPPPPLAELRFSFYLGEWKMLPDFTKLTAHREGAIDDGLLQIKLDDYKFNFGVVYTGKLQARVAGSYTFKLASDDGARFFLDGKPLLENDGVHPSKEIRSGQVKLTAGEHTMRVDYFQQAGEAELFLAWQGPDFALTPLSKWTPKNWDGRGGDKAKEMPTGLPLVAKAEPILYRNFIEGAGERGIGVGYPGGFNLAWSADHLNLALLWRGGFIDAARHWKERGGGAQPPMGYDVASIGGMSGPPFAVVAAGAPWPQLSVKERPEGYTWRGYTFDEQRFPVFHYDWQSVAVTERYAVAGDSSTPEGRIIRTLELKGPIPAGAFFRAATGTAPVKAEGARLLVEAQHRFYVQAEGAVAAGPSVLIPARAKMQITYAWPVFTETGKP